MTKAEVIQEIAEKTGLERADVSTVVEALFNVVKDNMKEGNNIYVRGFGSFVVRKRARKVARHIHDGKPLIIDEHFVPSFKPSKSFIEEVKSNVTKPVEA